MYTMHMNESIEDFREFINKYKTRRIGEVEKIFDVFYLHMILDNEDDFYVTKYGLPFIKHLYLGNYLTDDSWFNKHSVRLEGSSTTYKLATKKIDGISKDIVIKYNRMGQDIPGNEECEELNSSEFNSPFEEFSLLMELRNSKYESPGRIITQKPLAIYVPSERVELWQLGRREYKMQTMKEIHKDVELDMFRSYVMIYEWIKGIDAAQACREGFLDENEMTALTLRVEKEMKTVKYKGPHKSLYVLAEGDQ